MKHCPVNFLQIVAPCEDMSTPDRAHGLCLEDDFLAVPVLDECNPRSTSFALGAESKAQASTRRSARTTRYSGTPAAAGNTTFLAVYVLNKSQSVPDSQSDMQERAQASTTRTSEAQAMDNRPATTGTDRTPAAARNYTLVSGTTGAAGQVKTVVGVEVGESHAATIRRTCERAHDKCGQRLPLAHQFTFQADSLSLTGYA